MQAAHLRHVHSQAVALVAERHLKAVHGAGLRRGVRGAAGRRNASQEGCWDGAAGALQAVTNQLWLRLASQTLQLCFGMALPPGPATTCTTQRPHPAPPRPDQPTSGLWLL